MLNPGVRSIVENQIRATYAARPGQAGTDLARGRTYVASLLGYEELLRAARDVSYVARPLPLFYALSQAGRAIVAAHGPQPAVRGHGLREKKVKEPVTGMTVEPIAGKPGLFGAVAGCLGSGGLSGPVELGALWSANPDLADTAHGSPDWPPALFVWPHDFDRGEARPRVPSISGAAIVCPDAVICKFRSNPEEYLAAYPSARHFRLQSPSGVGQRVLRSTPRGAGFAGFFQTESEDGRTDPLRPWDEVPQHRYTQEFWLIPRVGVGDELPPLLLWWVLLFALSMLARYEPATWRAALDVERSLAVPLEDLMDEALEAVPHWVLSALLAKPFQLLRPGTATYS